MYKKLKNLFFFVNEIDAMFSTYEDSTPSIITLSPDARIFVKIHDAEYIEAGHIRVYAGESLGWLHGLLGDPEEGDRVHVQLRRLHNFPHRDRHYVASLENLRDVPFIKNQPSTCFIIDGESAWHTSLRPRDTSTYGRSSAAIQILTRNPLANNQYELFGGLLIPWDTRERLPSWVERSIAAYV